MRCVFSDTYGEETKVLYMNNSDRDITDFLENIDYDVKNVEEYNGSFPNLLHVAPHFAALNISDYNPSRFNVTVVYNDTMQHSLPILMNILTNSYYR